MTNKIHWVDKYLVPLNPCTEPLNKARKYPDPQSAWDAWDNEVDMLWVLQKANVDKSTLILCACDIAELTLSQFEQEYPLDEHPRDAIETARRYASDPTDENQMAADAAADVPIYNYFPTSSDVYAALCNGQADIVRKYCPTVPIF